MIITEVLENFIKHYKAFNDLNHLTDEKVGKEINKGDCGLAAIAVHYVLQHGYQIQTQITHNQEHCWLVFDNEDYDTQEIRGYHPDFPANRIWSGNQPIMNIYQINLPQACSTFMPCDALGGYLVKAFVEHYNLPMVPELQHCIDNVAEYERPEEIPVLENKYQQAKKCNI